jgi:hypothetical protein
LPAVFAGAEHRFPAEQVVEGGRNGQSGHSAPDGRRHGGLLADEFASFDWVMS